MLLILNKFSPQTKEKTFKALDLCHFNLLLSCSKLSGLLPTSEKLCAVTSFTPCLLNSVTELFPVKTKAGSRAVRVESLSAEEPKQ